MERKGEYGVICEWVEDDVKKWDVVHSGPISYDEACEITMSALKKSIEAQLVNPNLPKIQFDIRPIQFNLLKERIRDWEENEKNE